MLERILKQHLPRTIESSRGLLACASQLGERFTSFLRLCSFSTSGLLNTVLEKSSMAIQGLLILSHCNNPKDAIDVSPWSLDDNEFFICDRLVTGIFQDGVGMRS